MDSVFRNRGRFLASESTLSLGSCVAVSSALTISLLLALLSSAPTGNDVCRNDTGGFSIYSDEGEYLKGMSNIHFAPVRALVSVPSAIPNALHLG